VSDCDQHCPRRISVISLKVVGAYCIPYIDNSHIYKGSVGFF
jgi:hypothetical protein